MPSLGMVTINALSAADSVIRLLLKGYEPREKPDERFYDVMRELSAIGNNINQLAAKANTLAVFCPSIISEVHSVTFRN